MAAWFAACDGISRMGPYRSELAAYRALRLAPRASTTRIVATDFSAPDLGLTLHTTPEVKDGAQKMDDEAKARIGGLKEELRELGHITTEQTWQVRVVGGARSVR